MYEANTAVIGTVVTHPVRRSLSGGRQLVTFRMASNSRRFDREQGAWIEGASLFVTVSFWRRLAEGVDASIRRGDPIVAYGRLRTTEYRTEDGAQHQDLEMRASALGPDLGRCSAPVCRRGPGNSADFPGVPTEAAGRPAEPVSAQPAGVSAADADGADAG